MRTLEVDFTDGQSIYPKLQKELDQLEIGILVNNVGMSADFAQPFANMKSNQAVADIINWFNLHYFSFRQYHALNSS